VTTLHVEWRCLTLTCLPPGQVRADPISAFGGIVAFNRVVDEALAKEIREFRWAGREGISAACCLSCFQGTKTGYQQTMLALALTKLTHRDRYQTATATTHTLQEPHRQ
jgi:hypothetical protein